MFYFIVLPYYAVTEKLLNYIFGSVCVESLSKSIVFSHFLCVPHLVWHEVYLVELRLMVGCVPVYCRG